MPEEGPLGPKRCNSLPWHRDHPGQSWTDAYPHVVKILRSKLAGGRGSCYGLAYVVLCRDYFMS